MNKDTIYSFKDWDEDADIPTLHLSYLIHLLLPRRYFDRDRIIDAKAKLMEGFLKIRENFSPSLHIVPIGSKFEGYGIPDAIRLGDKPFIEYMSDIDATFVRDEFRAAGSECSADSKRNDVYINTSRTLPGYAHVCFRNPKQADSELLYHDIETDKFYLKSSALMDNQLSMINEDKEDSDKYEYLVHGPALSVNDPDPMTLERSKTDRLTHPGDHVIAIPVDDWPSVAAEWAKRKRSNGWLAPDVIQTITSGGCHVVPVSHKLSLNPGIDWRLSFALAEQYLAEYAVTAAQRQCYIYLKILRKQSFREDIKLSSYCLKNVFLYCCDELPKQAWEDDPAGCCLYMLDVLLEFVKKGNIPSYFLPENNLIGHLSDKELLEVKNTLESIRADPVSPALEFTDCRVLCYGPGNCLSYSTTFRHLVQLVLDEIASIEQLDNGRSILGCFTDIQCNLASVMLGEKRTSFWHHLDFYQFFVQRYVQMSFVDFLNYMGIRLETPFITLMFYEKCLAQVQVYPEMEYLRGNMACMCFSLAQTHDENSKERKARMHQAEKMYNEVLQKNGIHFATTIDFANFLCYCERWREAIALLESFAEVEERKQTGLQNGYYPAEATTLNEQLQREVKHNGCFLARSLSFCYYFLVQAYSHSNLPRLYEIMTKFEAHCANAGGYGDYELLGYSGIIAQKPCLSEKAFTKAATLTQNNALAFVNLNLIRQHLDSENHEDEKVLAKNTLRSLVGICHFLSGNVDKVVDLLFKK